MTAPDLPSWWSAWHQPSDKILSTPNNDLITVIGKAVDDAYYNELSKLCLSPLAVEKMGKDIKLVYTPVHGSGFVPVTTMLSKLGIKATLVTEQVNKDSAFSTVKVPNPEYKETLSMGIALADKIGADVVFGTDPDCDRIGIVIFDENRNPIYMTGNQTGSLLINYLLSTRKEQGILPDNGIMYNTIVSSPLGAKVASLYGVETEQTLTGFKYIGDKIARAIENNGKVFQIGYEESYGYLINPAVRDKDGVQSVMLICEMASYYKHLGKSLYEVFEEIQQQLGYHIETQHSYSAAGFDGVAKIANLMKTFRNSNIETIAGDKVVTKEDYDSLVKVTNGVEETLDYEQSNVLRYVFEDGSFVAVRPSGTEPKVKFYFAVCGKTQIEAQERHDRVKQAILSYIKD